MGYKNYTADMNVYMKKRYFRRMQLAKEQLGGVCVVCGTTENLEFDHVDPATKLFTIAKKAASVSEKRLQEELAKCQLLCHEHHIEKHAPVAELA